jgi:hypothetical protein
VKVAGWFFSIAKCAAHAKKQPATGIASSHQYRPVTSANAATATTRLVPTQCSARVATVPAGDARLLATVVDRA